MERIYDDLSVYVYKLRETVSALENKQKNNGTQNICGYCHDEGVIDGMNRVLRDLEKLLVDNEPVDDYDWDDSLPCGCCTCCGCICDM